MIDFPDSLKSFPVPVYSLGERCALCGAPMRFTATSILITERPRRIVHFCCWEEITREAQSCEHGPSTFEQMGINWYDELESPGKDGVP